MISGSMLLAIEGRKKKLKILMVVMGQRCLKASLVGYPWHIPATSDLVLTHSKLEFLPIQIARLFWMYDSMKYR
jgi:hypothetical protein